MARRSGGWLPPSDGTTIFTPWAWLLLSPFLLTAYGGYDLASDDRERLIGFTGALIVHLVVGAVFVVAAAVERRRRSLWARVAWAAGMLLVISAGRPALITAVQSAFGLDLVETPFVMRWLLNLFAFAGAGMITYGVVRSFHRMRTTRATLDAVRRLREAQTEAAAEATDRIVAEFEATVAQPVREALETVRARPFDAAHSAAALQDVAHEVVRPLSHRVFHSDIPATTALHVAAASPARRLPSRVLPAPVWAPVAVYIATLLPLAMVGFGAVGGSLRMLLAALVAIAGNSLVLLVRPRRPVVAVVLLSASYLMVGIAIAVAFLTTGIAFLPPLIAGVPVSTAYWVYTPFTYALITMLVAVSASAIREQRADERELVAALAAAERQAMAARARLVATAERVARVLHHQVQGDILAVALRLRVGSAGERDVDRLIHRVDAMLRAAMSGEGGVEVLEVSPEAIHGHAAAVLETWASVMDIETDSGPEPWEWLAARPSAAAIMLDAVTEGLTNAVRHAGARWARLRMRRTAEGVELTVRTPGRLRARSSDGMGLADLTQRGARVSLAQEGRTVVFTVSLQGSDPAAAPRAPEPVAA